MSANRPEPMGRAEQAVQAERASPRKAKPKAVQTAAEAASAKRRESVGRIEQAERAERTSPRKMKPKADPEPQAEADRDGRREQLKTAEAHQDREEQAEQTSPRKMKPKAAPEP